MIWRQSNKFSDELNKKSKQPRNSFDILCLMNQVPISNELCNSYSCRHIRPSRNHADALYGGASDSFSDQLNIIYRMN